MSHNGDEVQVLEEHDSDEVKMLKNFIEVQKELTRTFLETVNPRFDWSKRAADIVHVPSCNKVRPKLMGEGVAESLAVSKRPQTEEVMKTRNKRVFNNGLDLDSTSADDHSKAIRNLKLQRALRKGKASTGGAHVDCQGGSSGHKTQVEVEFGADEEKVILRLDATLPLQDATIRISYKKMCFELSGKQAA